MKKVLIYGTLTIAALAAIIWKLNANKAANVEKTEFVKKSNTGDIPVVTEKATRVDFDQQFAANGNFMPFKELTYLSEISGRINQLLVDEGSMVKAGQMLVRIDDEIVGTDLASAKANLQQLKVDKERYESAFKTGGVTQKQMDDARLQYDLAVSKFEAASRKVNDTYVKAPISGFINAKYVEKGTYLSPAPRCSTSWTLAASSCG